ncbi:MAG: IS3 family transposase, partial [Proteobacteria bacterium]|nr:IS3 family transposase [Pseudomonadota bacterium]
RVFFSSYTTREEARRDTVDYIEMFYNSNRRHSCLGYVSPKEFEKLWLLKKAVNKSVHFYLTRSAASGHKTTAVFKRYNLVTEDELSRMK